MHDRRPRTGDGRNPETLRDFLYARMRGAQDKTAEEGNGSEADDEALILLGEIRDALRESRLRSEADGRATTPHER